MYSYPPYFSHWISPIRHLNCTHRFNVGTNITEADGEKIRGYRLRGQIFSPDHDSPGPSSPSLPPPDPRAPRKPSPPASCHAPILARRLCFTPTAPFLCLSPPAPLRFVQLLPRMGLQAAEQRGHPGGRRLKGLVGGGAKGYRRTGGCARGKGVAGGWP